MGGWVPAFWHSGDHFGTSGAPSETVGIAGMTCGGLESKFYRFGDNLGAPFCELWGTEGHISVKQGSRMQGITKNNFHRN